MKEYICKDELIKTISEYEIYGNKDFLEDLFSAISSNTTVTKADICREFVEKVDERFIKSFQGTSITYSECAKLVLAEMESE